MANTTHTISVNPPHYHYYSNNSVIIASCVVQKEENENTMEWTGWRGGGAGLETRGHRLFCDRFMRLGRLGSCNNLKSHTCLKELANSFHIQA